MTHPKGMLGLDIGCIDNFGSKMIGGFIDAMVGFSSVSQNGKTIDSLSLVAMPGVEFGDTSSLYLKGGADFTALISLGKPNILFFKVPALAKVDTEKNVSLLVGTELGINIFRDGSLFLYAGGYLDVPLNETNSSGPEFIALLGIKALMFILD